jgi:hypothetical protein
MSPAHEAEFQSREQIHHFNSRIKPKRLRPLGKKHEDIFLVRMAPKAGSTRRCQDQDNLARRGNNTPGVLTDLPNNKFCHGFSEQQQKVRLTIMGVSYSSIMYMILMYDTIFIINNIKY